mmetsp:Transcript_98094/g.282979  ORF Transcript_98094/g.282979 Transcript_98094/m.282979 type:complete len:208 (-) Transcript_98094:96-719(-)
MHTISTPRWRSAFRNLPMVKLWGRKMPNLTWSCLRNSCFNQVACPCEPFTSTMTSPCFTRRDSGMCRLYALIGPLSWIAPMRKNPYSVTSTVAPQPLSRHRPKDNDNMGSGKCRCCLSSTSWASSSKCSTKTSASLSMRVVHASSANFGCTRGGCMPNVASSSCWALHSSWSTSPGIALASGCNGLTACPMSLLAGVEHTMKDDTVP